MHFLPQFNKFLKMFGGAVEDLPYIAFLRVSGSHGIFAIRKAHTAVLQQINNHLGLTEKAVNMTRLMVLWVSSKSHIIEAAR
jgi:hypothetical protein